MCPTQSNPNNLISTAEAQIVENIINDIYTFLKKHVSRPFRKKVISRRITELYEKINKIRMVKTLWQIDQPVNLNSFYCDSHVIFTQQNGKQRRKIIKNISDFGKLKNIVIQGIAGQGKSIFARYLCCQEFFNGGKIPVFIELRRIQNGEKLLDHISKFFEVIDIDVNIDIFKILCKSGKIIFILDGFDEIKENQKQRIINEIEFLAQVSDHSIMIVTSRPESGIAVSPVFNIVKLDNLKGKEYKNIIYKLTSTESKKLAERLVNQIELHKAHVQELLCTPLLVTLLLVSYKSFQEIPSQLSDFYDSIFQVLLQRHDGVKPGYQRPRKCKINDNQYRIIFEAFCYESKRKVTSIFTFDDVYQFAKSAIFKVNLEEDAENFLSDILQITCLLLNDGGEYKYIHKSVQEYYAASFIKKKPDSIAIKFYKNCVKSDYTGPWDQELKFLNEIDSYRYSKYYSLPLCSKVLDLSSNNFPKSAPKATLKKAKNFFRNLEIGFALESGLITRTCSLRGYPGYILHKYFRNFMNIDYSSFSEKVNTGDIDIEDYGDLDVSIGEKYIYHIPINKLLDNNFITDDFKKISQNIINDYYSEGKNALKLIEIEDSCVIDIDFIYD